MNKAEKAARFFWVMYIVVQVGLIALRISGLSTAVWFLILLPTFIIMVLVFIGIGLVGDDIPEKKFNEGDEFFVRYVVVEELDGAVNASLVCTSGECGEEYFAIDWLKKWSIPAEAIDNTNFSELKRG